MKLDRAVSAAMAVLMLAAAPLHAGEPPSGWDKLKSLAGTWKGTYEGREARLSYTLVSSGTALMETMDAPDAVQMVTLYHPDGAGLLLTHYCAAGNQPRMRAQGLEGGKLAFRFVDAANLKSPAEHVMTGLVLTFTDADHLIQEWTSRDGAKEQAVRFEFTRVR
jgi:hypothetical protein